MAIESICTALTESYPALSLTVGDDALLSRFRSYEPALVSILDKQRLGEADRLELVALNAFDEPSGIVTLITALNNVRKSERQFYARIDLVIVDPDKRNLGIARANVLAALLYLLESSGERLYSVSCLAAHAAIERILLDQKFVFTREADKFKHYERIIDDAAVSELTREVRAQLEDALQLVAYKVRQRKNT